MVVNDTAKPISEYTQEFVSQIKSLTAKPAETVMTGQ